ncbi:oligopeptide/dipeptide ABC transporter ATP-binding protein [Brevibacillus nitrificans]|uniref:oligopeptide/dipeptide ABC transporter ATP-binding protein n=1 Tax=Brevibacillus nitrificans TaxID=651560 RepID=UPI002856CE59|nr:oligopeptide/dipeptide ABC transporter ATP-binding protein [Brevibacillus nitrificans]MDR7316371.1 oligopeptide/dipeptide ABC transporter ATP-binding protein [Brevibacillus nitrificans]
MNVKRNRMRTRVTNILQVINSITQLKIGLCLLAVIILLALFAPFLAPHDPFSLNEELLAPPGSQYLLGTDGLGRDVFSELLYGARTSIFIGVVAAAISGVLGTLIGGLSGFYRGRLDSVLSEFVNVFLMLPTALDVVTQGQILKEIMQLEERLNITRIMITHDMSVVATTCKKVAVMYAGNLLEFGLVKDIIAGPEHPYTKGLLQSIPALKGERGELKGIAGSLPDLSKSPSGCIFADRCPSRKPTCETEIPIHRTLADGRMVACHIAGS